MIKSENKQRRRKRVGCGGDICLKDVLLHSKKKIRSEKREFSKNTFLSKEVVVLLAN